MARHASMHVDGVSGDLGGGVSGKAGCVDLDLEVEISSNSAKSLPYRWCWLVWNPISKAVDHSPKFFYSVFLFF